MKAFIAICCMITMSNALSLIIPDNRNYLSKIDYVNEQPAAPQTVDLISDEEQLLSKRVGRQYYTDQGSPTQNYDYGGYNGNGYNGYYYPSYPNYNRRSSESQRRRNRFGGIGSAIIV